MMSLGCHNFISVGYKQIVSHYRFLRDAPSLSKLYRVQSHHDGQLLSLVVVMLDAVDNGPLSNRTLPTHARLESQLNEAPSIKVR